MRNVNCNVLSGVDTTDQDGVQIDSNQLVSISFQSIFGDDTAAGTMQVQMSNDISNDRYQASNFVVTNWSDYPDASASVVAGVAAVIVIPQLCARWLRVVYMSASGGSSTVNVNMNALST